MADMASELEALAVRLRNAGQEDLARELTRAMSRGVRSVPEAIRAALPDRLPDRYAEVLAADVDIRTAARNSGADAVAQVYARPAVHARKLRYLDAGQLTHPLFGHRDRKWYTQEGGPGTGPAMHSGWFTSPAEDAAPQVRAELEQALDDVTAKAVSKGG